MENLGHYRQWGLIKVYHAISRGDAEVKMNIDKNGIQAGVSTHRPNR